MPKVELEPYQDAPLVDQTQKLYSLTSRGLLQMPLSSPCFPVLKFIVITEVLVHLLFCFYNLSYIWGPHPTYRTLFHLFSYLDPHSHPGIRKTVKEMNAANDSIL